MSQAPSGDAAAAPAEDSIRVICRFRPLNKSQLASGSQYVPKFKSENCVTLAGKPYIFDRVFDSNTTQEQFYEGAAKSVVKDVLCGYNGTIFAYGQTSSGKTHSMEGVIGDPILKGIIPRIVYDIFDHIYAGDENLVFQLKCSYFEIYLDKITDLLDPSKVNLPVHEDKNKLPFVKGATERFVSSPEEVFAVFEEGKSNRHITATNMNAESSRSHSIFLINVNQEHQEKQNKLTGKLYLVDLAGSEKISKTGAEGVVLDEAKNINKSLSALGNVISSLAEGVKSHIPYRDSKLTRILQESLGGNARTTILICCSPASFNEAETKSTLDFGKRAKTIKNAVRVNEELTAEEWKRRYNKEKEKVALLKGKIKVAELELEKWRQGETVSVEEQVSLNDDSIAPITTPSEYNPSLQLPTPVSNKNASAGNSDQIRFLEEEKERLYQQLDEKDDEITQQCQLVEQLKEQILEQENLIFRSRKDYEILLKDMKIIQTENDAANEEVQDVLKALEELALNYDQKVTEVEETIQESEKMRHELKDKEEQINLTADEILSHEEHTKMSVKFLTNLILALQEIQGIQETLPALNFGLQNMEKDFETAHLLISKTKSDYQGLLQACNAMKLSHCDCNEKMEKHETTLNEYRSKLGEAEAQVIVLEQRVKDVDSKKHILDQQVDALTKECSQLRAEGNTLETNKKTEKCIELYEKQLLELRKEVDSKQNLVEQLRGVNQQLVSKQQYIQEDLQRLKEEGPPTKCNFQEVVIKQNESGQGLLKDLQNKVSKELQALLNLRKMLAKDLESRFRLPRNENSEDDEDVGGSTLALKQNIKVLEANVQQLTNVHKLMVRENTDLRCGMLKAEKRIQATRERIKVLEIAYKQSKEKVQRDRMWYQREIDRIKAEAVSQRWKTLARRNSVAQIAKPIRAGGQPVSAKS